MENDRSEEGTPRNNLRKYAAHFVQTILGRHLEERTFSASDDTPALPFTGAEDILGKAHTERRPDVSDDGGKGIK